MQPSVVFFIGHLEGSCLHQRHPTKLTVQQIICCCLLQGSSRLVQSKREMANGSASDLVAWPVCMLQSVQYSMPMVHGIMAYIEGWQTICLMRHGC